MIEVSHRTMLTCPMVVLVFAISASVGVAVEIIISEIGQRRESSD